MLLRMLKPETSKGILSGVIRMASHKRRKQSSSIHDSSRAILAPDNGFGGTRMAARAAQGCSLYQKVISLSVRGGHPLLFLDVSQLMLHSPCLT